MKLIKRLAIFVKTCNFAAVFVAIRCKDKHFLRNMQEKSNKNDNRYIKYIKITCNIA